MIAVILYLTFAIVIFIYILYRNNYNYWSTKGVLGPKPLPIFGNYISVFFGYKLEAELLREIYESYSEDYVGIYKGVYPVLLVKNPAMIKQILLKDFDNFNIRCIEKPISLYYHSLYVTGDEKWKVLRRIFGPGMLSDRIEKMVPLIENSVDKYIKYIEAITKNHRYFDIQFLKNKYAFHVFSKLIFNKDHTIVDRNEIEATVIDFIDSKLQLSLTHIADSIMPSIASLVLNVQNILNTINYDKMLKDYIELLIHEVESRGAQRNNLLEFLIGMKETGKTRKNKDLPFAIDNDFIIQQTLTFFLTAFESTSSVLAFVIYELSQNEMAQKKCVQEICEIFDQNDEVTLELISQMNYLQQVINETLRKHAMQVIDRKCMKSYKFPNTNLIIDKNVFVYVPVHGLHNDPKYFANPDWFNPDRFSADNKAGIPQYAYLPFGDGPRMCIGHRLAMIVMIMGLSAFLRRFKVSPSKLSNTKLKYDPRRTRTLSAIGGLWVTIEKRED